VIKEERGRFMGGAEVPAVSSMKDRTRFRMVLPAGVGAGERSDTGGRYRERGAVSSKKESVGWWVHRCSRRGRGASGGGAISDKREPLS
jgi:hypothetical protein